MWSNKKSLFLSVVLVRITFFALIIFLFFVPSFADWYGLRRFFLNDNPKVPLMICTYIAEIPALIICILLDRLLRNIKSEEVFIHSNIKLIRFMSYCCIFAGFIFLAFSYYQPMSFFVFFACEFIGLILRVVKNVFEKAIELREENDYTI